MVEQVQGDIFVDGIGVLIHQANCHHSMQSGIAREIRARYPQAYLADLETPKADYAKLGTFSIAGLPENGRLRYIANLYSQYGHQDGDRKTSYDAMYAGLEAIRDDARFAGLDFAVPHKIGCGLAGGDWTVVRAILEAVFGGPRARMRIFELPAFGAGS